MARDHLLPPLRTLLKMKYTQKVAESSRAEGRKEALLKIRLLESNHASIFSYLCQNVA